ncbi:MAG: helix-turn-helix domain-containing protein, partial [Candidatus Adiutrix sp.]
EDIPLLVDFFLKRFQKTRLSEVIGINHEAQRCLLTYNWPGNVRELENLVERMVTLSDNTILTVDDVPPKLLEATLGLSPPEFAVLPKTNILNMVPPQEISLNPSVEPLACPNENQGDGPTAPSDFEASLGGPREESRLWEPVLPDPLNTFPPEGVDFNALISAYEDKLIRSALVAADGVKNQAAKLLGLNRTTLVEKMRKKDIVSEEN